MSFPERRSEFQGACDPISGIPPAQWGWLKCFGANYPKYRVAMQSGGKLSAYRLSENNMPVWQLRTILVIYYWDTRLEVISKQSTHPNGG